MNRKVRWLAGVAAAVAVTSFIILSTSYPEKGDATTEAGSPEAVRAIPLPGHVATTPPRPESLQQASPHPLAVTFGENPDAAAAEPAQLMEILRFYRMEFGSFPAGQENSDIMNALTGNNPGRLPVFPRKHPRIDSRGNLLDAWGHAFIFHPVSSQHLEVRSKGPDGEIFTADDILISR